MRDERTSDSQRLMVGKCLAKVVILLACHAGILLAESNPITPELPSRPKVLLDYYHHSDPQLKIGRFIVTGGCKDNIGRYGINDFLHTNSFDPLVEALERDYALIVHRHPLTAEYIKGVDIIFIFTPDSKQLVPDTPLITDEEIDDMEAFVRSGGSLLLMVNSYHLTEKFDQIQMRKLFQRFGLDWNDDDTKYADIAIGLEHPYFYDMDVFHYGAGCTIKVDPKADAEVLLHVHGDVGHEDVEGPGIVMVRLGKGKVAVVGDTGSWGANMSRPWAENKRFLQQLFGLIKRDTGIRSAKYSPKQKLHYKMTAAKVRVMPTKNTLNAVEQPGFEVHIPRKKTRIPYIEETADITLICREVTDGGVQKCDVSADNYKQFDRTVELPENGCISVALSRLGDVADMKVNNPAMVLFSADMTGLFTFLPNDGIRVGDRWKKTQQFKVLPIQGTDLGAMRPIETEMCYVGDEEINGRKCRKILTLAAVWLSDLDVSARDVLPEEYVRRWAGEQYELYGRGGRMLVKREQWIDFETSIVVQARTQHRVVMWIRDLNNPAGPDISDIDNKMIVVASQDIWLRLED